MKNQKIIFYQTTTQTPIGQVTIIADQSYIYLVKFSDTKNLENIIKKLCKAYHAILEQGTTQISTALNIELQDYFNGKLKTFTTPVLTTGTCFQKHAWQELDFISYGTTCSYSKQAIRIKNPSATRAIAGAYASNLIAIMIPCHRVIGKNGKISGYNGSTYRKEWLLNHEKKHSSS